MTVKRGRALLVTMVTDSATAPAGLQGTPVVGGLAFGPALVIRTEVPQEALTRFGDGGFADEEAALAAYDVAVEQVSAGFGTKAAKASGAAAEVLTASAGLARDKGLRSAVKKSLTGGAPIGRASCRERVCLVV